MRLLLMFTVAVSLGSVAEAHSCSIERAITDGDGVRVFYYRGGMGGGYGPYETDFVQKGKPLTLSRSQHSFCALEVVEKGGRIGVQADWSTSVPGIGITETGKEWIEAVPPSPPYIHPAATPIIIE